MCRINKFYILIIFYTFVSCSSCKTPPLPDINTKSFSYEEIVKKKNALLKSRSSSETLGVQIGTE